MIKTYLALLMLLAQEPLTNAPLFTIAKTWTNNVPFLIANISTHPVDGVCPECGGPNHHVRQVNLMGRYDEVYQTIVLPGHRTNQLLVFTGPTNKFIVTNIVYGLQRTQPGWRMPPPLIPTNR